ncbi:hypothetical protein [Paraburkholderia hayleyella]|uniref:hypothetical protein n=1 Tax=Paraburkholderia hayleyella TaxID=2152889 RepID=UPI001292418D|nr:hypothetical protein [Paraburkholderia hayleyella]
MGWAGLVVLGLAVGLMGWWLHPLRRMSRVPCWMALLVGVLGTVLANMTGNLTGFFHDGSMLEWPVCTAVALIAVAMTVGMLRRR